MKNSSQHILMVDDDPDCLRLLGNLLSQQGYRIHAAESGERALEIVDMISGELRLDVVLLDILMPKGISGIETCRLLKAHPATRDTPVIFLTGKHDVSTTVDAFEAGCADFIHKPFNNRLLLARVRAHAQLGLLSKHLELILAERTRDLRDANAALHRLTREMSHIEERERERLAGDLHDSPMQKLALAQAQIVSAARHRDKESDQQLEIGVELMREALQELRSLQFELSPPVLRQEGLASALRWLASHCTQRFGVNLSFFELGISENLEPDLAAILFRCVRELVHNLAKHAEASTGCIELQVLVNEIRLTVSNDGKGFPNGEQASGDNLSGYGLFSVRERISLLGGSLSVVSKETGSSLLMRVPRQAVIGDCFQANPKPGSWAVQ